MIFILDRDEKVIGVLTNNGSPDSCPYYEDTFMEDLDTGSTTYEFKVPASHNVSELLVEGNYIVRKDLDDNFIMFTIMNTEETHTQMSEKHVYCEGAGLELINDIVRPIQLDSIDAEQALTHVLQDTRWELGETEYFGIQNVKFEDYISVLEALQAVASQYEGELQFRVIMQDGHVTHRYVDLVAERGTDTKKRFVYGKDITSIKRTVDMSDLATALIGVGKDGLDFKSIGYYTSNGDPFTKPLNQDWVGDDTALEVYGAQGRHVFGTFSYDTNEPLLLLQKTYQELQRRKQPSVTYDVEVALLERMAGIEHEAVRLGDTVYVVDETFSPALYLEARVRTLETSFSDPTKDKCTLGNYVVVKSNITTQMRDVQAKLLKKESTWDEVSTALSVANTAQTTATNAQTTASNAETTANTASTTATNAQSTANTAQTTATNAQGTADSAMQKATNLETVVAKKVTVTYSNSQPTGAITNDIWYKTDANTPSLIIGAYVYDGTSFVEKKLDAITLSVGQLSALTSNLGQVTAGSINIGSGKFYVDSAGNFTAQNAQLQSGTFSGNITSTATISGGSLMGTQIQVQDSSGLLMINSSNLYISYDLYSSGTVYSSMDGIEIFQTSINTSVTPHQSYSSNRSADKTKLRDETWSNETYPRMVSSENVEFKVHELYSYKYIDDMQSAQYGYSYDSTIPFTFHGASSYDFNSQIKANAGVQVTGAVSISDYLYVTGNTTVAGGLAVSTDTNVTGNLTVGGQINIDNLVLLGNSIRNPNTSPLYLKGYYGDSAGEADLTLSSDTTGPKLYSLALYNRTYSSGATVTVTSAGTLGRISSSSRYKVDIQAESDLTRAEKLLALEPKSWIDKKQAYSKRLGEKGIGADNPEVPTGALPRHHGLIAEDFISAGLPEFVVYDEQGQPDSLQYERAWTLLIPIIKDLKSQVEQLKAQINGGA